MAVSDWWIQARLTFDEIKAAAERAFQIETQVGEFTELTQLEDRVLMSASPIAIVAAPEADVEQDAAILSTTVEDVFDADQTNLFSETPRSIGDTLALLDQVDDNLLAVIDDQQSVLELVIIDESVADYQQLVSDLTADRDDGRSFELVILDANRDGIEQISEALANHDQTDAVHIVSHSTDRAIKLGNLWLTSDNLESYEAIVSGWTNALTEDADLLVYGCDIAAGQDGRAILNAFSDWTGADVAASDDDTGAAILGGDWELEYSIGTIESTIAFRLDVQADWHGLLNNFMVTNTNDSGAGSLRQAITDANTLAGADTISFNIAGTGVHTINLSSTLTITDTVTIDATTDDSFASNGNQPAIVLDGNNSFSGDGLVLTSTADGSTIRGFVIRDFSGNGIQIDAGSDSNLIAGNYIGSLSDTGADAGAAEANTQTGINVLGSNNMIGGTTVLDRNVLSGNTLHGVRVSIGAGSGNVISGNYIGVAADGTTALGNLEDGIRVEASNTTIGGTVAGAGNIVANHGTATSVGIWLTNSSTDVSILGNSIFNNAEDGIGLGPPYGVIANDAGDADTGNNDLQNYAVLTSAGSDGSGRVAVAGSLNTTANTTARIEFFGADVAAAGNGEGQTYLGYTNVITDGSGNASFVASFDQALAVGQYITSTTTVMAAGGTYGSTSQFSANVQATSALVVDTTADIVDGTTTSISALLGNKGFDGKISLREAVIASNNTAGSNTIFLPSGTYTLTRTGASEEAASTGDLDIFGNLVIAGDGAGTTTVDANGIDRVFDVPGTAQWFATGLTITGGSTSASGAGIQILGSGVGTISDAIVSGNSTSGSGGGFYNDGILNLDRVRVTNNFASNAGGGIDNDETAVIHNSLLDNNWTNNGAGGINTDSSSSNLTLVNSTISNNTAVNTAGGVYNGKILNARNVTIVENTGGGGAGIALTGGSTTTVSNSIITSIIGGVYTDAGNNLIDGVPDPLTNSLADNGGPILTQSLQTGSPAIDAGNATDAPAIDQRGYFRDSSIDIGAYEYIAPVSNNAPVLDNTQSPILTAVDEDAGAPSGVVGSLVSSLVDFTSPSGQVDNVTDVDSGASLGIAITAADATNGTWYYSIDNGSNWNALGAVSDSNARLLAADLDTRLYFQPNADYHGTLANAITFHAWDQTSGTNGDFTDFACTCTVRDEFQSVSYSNHDGSSNWTSSWIEADDDGAASSGKVEILSGQLRLHNLGGGTLPSITRQADLAGATSATLSFDYDGFSTGMPETFRAWASDNGGSTWVELEYFNPPQTGIFSGTRSYDLASSISLTSNVAIKLSLEEGFASSSDPNWVDFDNIQIEYTVLGVTGGTTAYSATTDTASLVVNAVADTPTMTNTTTNEDTQSTGGLVISRNAVDGTEVTHFKITGITDGTLYKNDGVTQITNGSFITFAEGNAGLKFTPTADFNGTGNFTVQASTSSNDAGLGGSTSIANITVNPVNDLPIADLNGVDGGGIDYSATFTEGDSPVSVTDSDATISDVDNATYDGLGINLAGFADGTSELIRINGVQFQFGVADSQTTTVGSTLFDLNFDGTGYTITRSGGGTIPQADLQALMLTITYENTSDAPTVGNRTFQIIPQDAALAVAAPVAVSTISVAAVNDAPITSITLGAPTFVENGGAVLLFSGASVDLVEASDLVSNLVITVDGLENGSDEVLVVDGQAIELFDANSETTAANGYDVDVSVAGTTATVTITKAGNYTAAAAETLLNTLAYNNTGDQVADGGRVVTYASITDDGGGTDTSVVGTVSLLTVNAVNDAPVLDNSGTMTLPTITKLQTNNNGADVSTIVASAGGDRIADADSNTDSSAVEGIAITSLVNGNGTWEYSINGGSTWTSIGTVSNTSALLLRQIDQVRFVPNGIDGTTASFDFHAWDQTAGTSGTKVSVTSNGGTTAFSTATETAEINVSNVNVAPVLDDTQTPLLTAINEDVGAPIGIVGSLVSSLVDLDSPSGQLDNVTDADSGAGLGIAITAVDTTNGIWFYSIDNGTTWNALGAVSDSNARLLAADAGTRLYFQGNADFHGTLANAITFHAWDQTSGSNGGMADISVSTNDTVLDEFNVSASFAGNDGTQNWIGDWQEIGELDGAGSGRIQVSSATTVVAGSHLDINLMTLGRGVSREANLDGTSTATLSFWYEQRDAFGTADLLLEVYNGASWHTLQSYKVDSDINTAQFESFDITAFAAADTQVRFLVTNDGGIGHYFYVDDLQIQYTVTAQGGTTAFSTVTDTASLVVNPVADTPSVTNTTTSEDTQSTTGLVISRNAADGTEVTHFKITGISDGTLYKNDGLTEITNGSFITVAEGSAGLKFTPSADFNGNGYFTIQSSTASNDTGLGGSTIDATVDVTAVNDAPVLDNTGLMDLPNVQKNNTDPNGSLVSTIIASAGGDRITDVDSGAIEGIAVTSVDDTNGTWQYSTDGGSTWTAFGAVTSGNSVVLSDTANDRIRFVPGVDYVGSATFDFRAWDTTDGSVTGNTGVNTGAGGGTSAFSTATETVSVEVEPTEIFFWYSTSGDVGPTGGSGGGPTSGTPGLTNWSEGQVIGFGDPNMSFGVDTTDGTFLSITDFDAFATDTDVEMSGMHYVANDITITGAGITGGSLDLQKGDVIFVTLDNESFSNAAAGAPVGWSNSIAISGGDVYVFRTEFTNDYSSGYFHHVMNDPSAGGLTGITLVENAVNVGDTALSGGDFLFAQSGAADQNDISWYDTSMATSVKLIEGDNLGIDVGINGLQLIDEGQTLGSVSVATGAILVSVDAPDAFGSNNLPVTEHDAVELAFTATTWGSGTAVATAAIVFDGDDVGLDHVLENIDALTLVVRGVGTNQGPTLGASGADANYVENAPPSLIDSTFTVLDADSPDFAFGLLRVDITSGANANDRLSVFHQGIGPGEIGVDHNAILYQGVTIATFSGGHGSDPLVFSLNANANVISTRALMRNITFGNVSDDPGTASRTVEFVLTDGDGAASNVISRTVNVSETADAPLAVNDNRGLDFDGIDDYVAIANGASLTMSNTMTLEAWINPDASTNVNRMILNKEGEYEVALFSDNRIYWAFANTDPGWTWHDTGYTVANDQWTHIAVSYDNGTVSTYVNGTLIDTYNGSGAIGDSHATQDELRIGGRSNNPADKFFDGQIDDVRIWEVARSEAEIQANLDVNLTGAEADLAGYWTFEDGTGSTAADLTINANHGTLVDGGSGAAGPQWTGYVTDQDTFINIAAIDGIVANDVDSDGDTLTVTQVNGNGANVGSLLTIASGANVTVGADGAFLYDPNGAFDFLTTGQTANDTFTYQIDDGNGGTDTATVSITITGSNDAPQTTNLNAAEIYTEEIALNLSDIVVSDVDDANVTVTLTLSDIGAGTLSTGTSGAVTSTFVAGVWTAIGAISDVNTLLSGVTFTPTGDYATDFTIATTVDDGEAAPVVGVKNFTATAINDAPVLTAGSVNDLTVIEDSGFTSLGLGGVTYDFGGGTDETSQTLTYQVTAIPSPVLGDVYLADGLTKVTATTYTLTQLQGMQFKPAAEASGGPSVFSWRVIDNGGTAGGGVDTLVQSIQLSITPVNDSPTFVANNGASVLEGSTGNVINNTMLHWNDVDDGASELTYTITAMTNNGTIHLAGFGALGLADTFTQADIDAGDVTYTHSGSETTSDAFSFSLADGGEDGALPVAGTFNIFVTAVNDAAIANADNFNVDNDSSLNVSAPGILANDSDVDSGSLSVILVTGPSNGAFTLAADGSFTYTPAIGFAGTDSFVYTVSDGTDISTATTVTITVNDVVGGPIAEPEPEIPDPVEEETEEDDQDEQAEPTLVDSVASVIIPVEAATPSQGKQMHQPEPATAAIVVADVDVPVVDSESEREFASGRVGRHHSYLEISGADKSHRNSRYLSAFFEFDTGSLFDHLNSVIDDIQNQETSFELVAGTAVVTSGAFSVGFVLWAARASYFATMLSTSLPAWAVIDPVPVLDADAVAKRSEKRGKQRHDKSLADILDEVQVSVSALLLDDHLCPTGTQLEAVTRDISKDGIGIVCTKPIAASHVRLQLTTPQGQALDVLGSVRHCSPEGEKYHVGVSVVADWS
ncbi:PilZ domain protein [Planctomycetes bacterium CA13]|uniref:PilZ domain protein n=1 Tax=Novipirellula herctigrandis TaxID=2527986 RepID=A0A5C5ZEC1_9BACT|nr:PilZ domain protein [Planctomycetes bacterium CA13]